MSKESRRKEYERLIENDKAGRIPGISQDDGSLVKEFGEPEVEAPKDQEKPVPSPPKPKAKGKK